MNAVTTKGRKTIHMEMRIITQENPQPADKLDPVNCPLMPVVRSRYGSTEFGPNLRAPINMLSGPRPNPARHLPSGTKTICQQLGLY
mmetsp:Transcript_8395/g.15006  ORF Transcript_8395/g.15006 Transcript_8395/m.15006 type:complete len:87 (+) Transcript_8395:1933-2193(+)